MTVEEEKTMKTIEEMLKYYGFETIEEYGRAHGYYTEIDAIRNLKSSYEEDILWDDEQ